MFKKNAAGKIVNRSLLNRFIESLRKILINQGLTETTAMSKITIIYVPCEKDEVTLLN